MLGIDLLLASPFLFMLARKQRIEHPWLSFIPIANLVMPFWLGNKSGWRALWLLVPIVAIIVAVMMWYDLATTLRRSGWWTWLLILPLVNIGVLAYFAFTQPERRPAGEGVW